ncbi:hypothetical protein Leryth_011217 [Lithospermum erythrorhizon]|nr:hypothetical protein Leryth_011217 [Lithospermum erythrorhizon]
MDVLMVVHIVHNTESPVAAEWGVATASAMAHHKQESGSDTIRGYKRGISEQDRQSTEEKWGDIDTFCYDYGFYQDTEADKLIRGPESQKVLLELHQPTLPVSNDLQILGKQYLNYINNVGPTNDGDKEKKGFTLTISSSNLLKHDLEEFKSSNREWQSSQEDGTGVGNPKLSTDQIMRLAGLRFIEFASYMFININANMHPHGSRLTGLKADDKLDVELVQLLFTVAEKISHNHTSKACRLLTNCKKLSSNIGTPVQRAVFYFAEALTKKIEKETEIVRIEAICLDHLS